jgi:hypothetical protein
MDDDVERLLFASPDVHVYKIPPRQSASGYKAGDWEGNLIWGGRCTVYGCGTVASIRLEDKSTGEPFAVCKVQTGPGAPQAVERVLDSSRYFVLRIVDEATGKHAFIGMGFTERSEAFDFQVALQDFAKHSGSSDVSEEELAVQEQPKADFSLHEGQKIQIDIKGKLKSGGAPAAGGASSGSGGKLAPPGAKKGGLLPPPK